LDILAYLSANVPWSWILGGLVLLGLELVVPGGYLLWMGIAAVLTGIITLVQPLAWPLQWLIFGALSLVAILAWTGLARHRREVSTEPELNQRTHHFIGHEAVLDQPIVDGFGRLRLGDTIWRVAGPDLPTGQRVRIIGAEGPLLRVEPV
jgi:membrane protein implicated in regulation of membrane protease activity